MEFTVEIADGVTGLSEPVPSAPAPNQKGEAATTEYAMIMSDPTHPMHAGYRRGEKSVMDHIEKMYRDAYPGTGESETGRSVTTGGTEDSAPALAPEDVQLVEALRSESEWGTRFEEHLSEARWGSSRLTQKLGAEAEDLTTACLDAGLDLKQILKIASHFERRRREHEQGSRP